MNTEAARPNLASRFVTFLGDVRQELEKVTWPERPQVIQLSLYVVAFSLVVGMVIALMDLALQGILLRLIPSIFGR